MLRCRRPAPVTAGRGYPITSRRRLVQIIVFELEAGDPGSRRAKAQPTTANRSIGAAALPIANDALGRPRKALKTKWGIRALGGGGAVRVRGVRAQLDLSLGRVVHLNRAMLFTEKTRHLLCAAQWLSICEQEYVDLPIQYSTNSRVQTSARRVLQDTLVPRPTRMTL